MKRIVFTQAGAGLVDSEVGDTYGNEMKEVLDGMLMTMYQIHPSTDTQAQSTSRSTKPHSPTIHLSNPHTKPTARQSRNA